MRLMLHILKKDARRLWPVAAPTWVLLAVVADLDRRRTDSIVSSAEGWLNLMLPLVWACLLALAVLEEPLVGDRNFWTTRPYPRASLVAAKLAFAAGAIHLPVLLAESFILVARGFSSPFYLGELLWKQLILMAVVTLRALALASLVRNFAHFVIAVFAIAGGLAVISGGLQRFPDPSRDALRHGVVILVLGLAAVTVFAIQYAWRWVLTSRLIATMGALVATMLALFLPVRAEYAFASAPFPVRIILRDARPDDEVLRAARVSPPGTVVIPITVEQTSGEHKLRVPMVDLEITTADGTRIRSAGQSRGQPLARMRLEAFAYALPDRSVNGLVLRLSSAALEHAKTGPVQIRGSAGVEFYQNGQIAEIPAQGTGTVPRMGRCTAMVVDDYFSSSHLKVLCESPSEMPAATVVLRHQASGREWRRGLNAPIGYSRTPHESWLSPVWRSQAYFPLAGSVDSGPDWERAVPRQFVPALRIAIEPEIPTGHALVPFELKVAELAR